MLRRIAVVGDRLSSGGAILTYRQEKDFMFQGHQVALIGGEAYCETCKSTGTISKAGGPRRMNNMGMREIALDRDMVLCKCERHPHIVAVHAGDSTVDDEAEKYAAAANATSAGTRSAGNARTQSGATYDEQVTAIALSASLQGYPFLIEMPDGQTVCGRADTSGRLPRICTDSADSCTVHWGDEALSHEDWK